MGMILGTSFELASSVLSPQMQGKNAMMQDANQDGYCTKAFGSDYSSGK